MRIASIDILRALTMVLMIWVNDFFTLINVPKWLSHAKYGEDYLGFSDIIFPLFLFIVGLSIPLAICQRKSKGDSTWQLAWHIIVRSLSLLLIGVYMVNWETAYSESMIIGKDLWCLLMAIAVVLIWTNWKRSALNSKWHKILQLLGVLILAYLAIIYKGGEYGDKWMTTHWWGILGLIGWAYLVNGLVYLFAKGNLLVMIIFWLVLFSLSIVDISLFSIHLSGFARYFSVIVSGTVPAFTAAGIVATLVLSKMSKSNMPWKYLFLILMGIANISFGLLTRPYWGISKIQGTPSWLAICTGIGFLLFAVLYFIADEKKKTNWANIIAPAGTATLACYMVPYFVYPLRNIIGFRFPDFINAGIIGLIVSFGYALLVVFFIGWLEKKGYKLKL